MVFKINKHSIKSDKGFGLIEILLAVLLISIAIVGLFAAFAYGKAQLKEESYRRLAILAAQGEIEIWREQARNNFDNTCYYREPQIDLTFFSADNENIKARIERECSRHTKMDMNYQGSITYYDVAVTVYWEDQEADLEQNEDSKVTLYGRFIEP